MSDLIVSALQDKRAELSRRVESDTQAIAAINVILALYEPETRETRSGVTRIILDIVRTAPTPPTIREVAAKLAEAKGAADDVERFVSRTERILYRLRLRRIVESVDTGAGRTKGWRVAHG